MGGRRIATRRYYKECRNRSSCPRNTTPAPSRHGCTAPGWSAGPSPPVPTPGREPYVIVIPPPNVTGVLHMGHGLNNTIQDVLIRFERARGRETLWLPGHRPRRDRHPERGRAAASPRRARPASTWAARRSSSGCGSSCAPPGARSSSSSSRSAASCDWSRTRFTLDPAYTRAVREVFVRLWEKGLIYRGHRVIHWCPRCLTALSDEEAEFHETTGDAVLHPLSR